MLFLILKFLTLSSQILALFLLIKIMIDLKHRSGDTLPVTVTPPTENEITEINTFMNQFLED